MRYGMGSIATSILSGVSACSIPPRLHPTGDPEPEERASSPAEAGPWVGRDLRAPLRGTEINSNRPGTG